MSTSCGRAHGRGSRLNLLCTSAHTSPNKFRANLTNARIPSSRDITEAFVADISARVVKLRVVEDVEEFTSNLEMHCFIEGDQLRDSQVGVVESGAVKEPAVRCPE